MKILSGISPKIALGCTVLGTLAAAGNFFINLETDSSENEEHESVKISTTGEDSPVIYGVEGDVTLNLSGEKHESTSSQ